MKTTIEIKDSLLRDTKSLAVQEGTSVRALVEEGLRHVLDKRSQPEKFQLRKVSFKGNGLVSDLKDASWEEIRDRAYEGRGS